MELLATDLRSPEGTQEVNHLPVLDSCVFRVVKHCAQTDNCPSLGYKGAQATVWYSKQRFHSTNNIIIQDSA